MCLYLLARPGKTKKDQGRKKRPRKGQRTDIIFSGGEMGEFSERKKTHRPLFNSKAGQTEKRPRRPKKGHRRPKKAEKMYFFIVVYTTVINLHRLFDRLLLLLLS